LKRHRRYKEKYAYVLLLFATMIIAQKLILYIFVMGEVRASFPMFVSWAVMIEWCIRVLDG